VSDRGHPGTVALARPPLVVLAGPTATGKTGLSLHLAQTVPGAEIISADATQVYRGMDIGTAKVSRAERERVPHHGLDLVEPDEPFSVADFTSHADAALDAIAARRGWALLVGGTGFYIRALARGLALDLVPSDAALRTSLELELQAEGLPSLVARLRHLAPTLAAAVDLRNARRVVRALEIASVQGDAPLPPARGFGRPVLWLGLDVEPGQHREWIVRRARQQFDAGLIEEAAALRERFGADLRSFSAIGYREAFGVLDGTLTREEAIAQDAARNVALARRQRTWFRREPEIGWLDASGRGALEQARERVESYLGREAPPA
jgi:tRNA dimethylallyltransferase